MTEDQTLAAGDLLDNSYTILQHPDSLPSIPPAQVFYAVAIQSIVRAYLQSLHNQPRQDSGQDHAAGRSTGGDGGAERDSIRGGERDGVGEDVRGGGAGPEPVLPNERVSDETQRQQAREYLSRLNAEERATLRLLASVIEAEQ